MWVIDRGRVESLGRTPVAAPEKDVGGGDKASALSAEDTWAF